jgi:hypothetical protein
VIVNIMNITALKPAAQQATPKRATKAKVAPKSKAKKSKAAPRPPIAAIGIGAVGVALTGLSLVHLSDGITTLTHCADWQGWAMAIGLDANFVATEAAVLAVDDETRKRISLPANITKAVTLAGSAALNAYSFAGHADGLVTGIAAGVLGAAIPGLIFAATQMLAKIIHKH